MTNPNQKSVFDLTAAEKLQLVEDLWDDLASCPETVPIFAWQKKELEQRKINLLEDPASGQNWEVIKRRIPKPL